MSGPIIGQPRPLLPDGSSGKPDRGVSIWKALAKHLRRSYRKSVLPILLREFCNLGRRISLELQLRRELSLGLPTVHGLLRLMSVEGPESYRRSYIRGMKQLEEDRLLSSTWDRIVATRMWIAGTKCPFHSACTSPHQCAVHPYSPDIASANSKLLSTTQQETTTQQEKEKAG